MTIKSEIAHIVWMTAQGVTEDESVESAQEVIDLLLEMLPKEIEYKDLDIKEGVFRMVGYNQCLSEIKEILK